MFFLQLLKIIILLKSYYFREIEARDRIGSKLHEKNGLPEETNRGKILYDREKIEFFFELDKD